MSSGPRARPAEKVAEADRAFFQGIVRADGRVATRNFIGVLPTVSCSAGVVRLIADAVSKEELASLPPGRRGGRALPRLGPAAWAGTRRDMSGSSGPWPVTPATPTSPGVLLVGLGCEANQLDDLLGNMNLEEGPLLRTLNIQDQGGTRGTVGKGAAIVREMMARADRVERTRGGGRQAHPGLGVRRLGRLFRDLGQPGPGPGRGPLGRPGRNPPSSARPRRSTGPSTCSSEEPRTNPRAASWPG